MPLSVIGAGMGRTGTMSLKLALDQLGFGPCYHMVEVFKNAAAPTYWSAAADGAPMDWEQVFSGYNSTVDHPSTTFWRELADAYPEAKVILTVRDPDAWYRSTQETIFAHDIPDPPTSPWEAMIGKIMQRDLDGDIHTRDHLIARYHAHNARVQASLPPERLLVYEVRQGWEPLCDFLGVAVPDGPMPHANSSDEFRERRLHPAMQS